MLINELTPLLSHKNKNMSTCKNSNDNYDYNSNINLNGRSNRFNLEKNAKMDENMAQNKNCQDDSDDENNYYDSNKDEVLILVGLVINYH